MLSAEKREWSHVNIYIYLNYKCLHLIFLFLFCINFFFLDQANFVIHSWLSVVGVAEGYQELYPSPNFCYFVQGPCNSPTRHTQHNG